VDGSGRRGLHYLAQMVGWLDGLSEGALLDRRKAEAEAKRIGFE